MVMANRQEENGDVEGFGIVFLEGSAAGKPVVGGRSGGAVEAIEEGVTGYLVDPDNADELVGVLRKLLLDPELREKLGAAGARRVRAEFNWKTRAEALEALNCKILESRRGVARPSESTHSSVASGDLHRTGAVSKNH
jgi:phosphatidylinositol alpha-1,6-mannosyltransferase